MELLERFMAKVNKNGENGCWEWTGDRNEDGYGQFRKGRFTPKAHRVSYELFVGNIPFGICVCHHCDNPSCVNPKHLFLGTKLDNARDRDAKGRGVFFSGEKHNMAKLTEQQVKDIKSSFTYERGELTALAKKYNVTISCISNIKHNRIWKEVE